MTQGIALLLTLLVKHMNKERVIVTAVFLLYCLAMASLSNNPLVVVTDHNSGEYLHAPRGKDAQKGGNRDSVAQFSPVQRLVGFTVKVPAQIVCDTDAAESDSSHDPRRRLRSDLKEHFAAELLPFAAGDIAFVHAAEAGSCKDGAHPSSASRLAICEAVLEAVAETGRWPTVHPFRRGLCVHGLGANEPHRVINPVFSRASGSNKNVHITGILVGGHYVPLGTRSTSVYLPGLEDAGGSLFSVPALFLPPKALLGQPASNFEPVVVSADLLDRSAAQNTTSWVQLRKDMYNSKRLDPAVHFYLVEGEERASSVVEGVQGRGDTMVFNAVTRERAHTSVGTTTLFAGVAAGNPKDQVERSAVVLPPVVDVALASKEAMLVA